MKHWLTNITNFKYHPNPIMDIEWWTEGPIKKANLGYSYWLDREPAKELRTEFANHLRDMMDESSDIWLCTVYLKFLIRELVVIIQGEQQGHSKFRFWLLTQIPIEKLLEISPCLGAWQAQSQGHLRCFWWLKLIELIWKWGLSGKIWPC